MVRRLMALNFQRMTPILPSLCKLRRVLLLHRPWGMEEGPYTFPYINKQRGDLNAGRFKAEAPSDGFPLVIMLRTKTTKTFILEALIYSRGE